MYVYCRRQVAMCLKVGFVDLKDFVIYENTNFKIRFTTKANSSRIQLADIHWWLSICTIAPVIKPPIGIHVIKCARINRSKDLFKVHSSFVKV